MLPIDVPVSSGHFLSGITHSETWYYRTKLVETTHPAKVNSTSAINGQLIGTIEGTEYSSAEKAKASIPGYYRVDTSQTEMAIDLGHGIKGMAEGAAGHGYISWNEGRWLIRIDSPNDPTYQVSTYKDSKALAKKVVTYLNQYALPAPQKIGVITISTWKNTNLTTIKWQFHEMTYQVTSHNPFTALKIAVAMRLNS